MKEKDLLRTANNNRKFVDDFMAFADEWDSEHPDKGSNSSDSSSGSSSSSSSSSSVDTAPRRPDKKYAHKKWPEPQKKPQAPSAAFRAPSSKKPHI
jgi:hypothetical protein